MTDYTSYSKPLWDNLNKLNAKDRAFAESLFAQLHKKNGKGLSDKQWFWVKTLAERATAPAPAPAAQLGDMAGLYGLFEKAAAKLKRPAIVVATPVGAVKLSLAGKQAKHPGTVNVAEDGPFGEARFYGRIAKDGAFTASFKGCQGSGLHQNMPPHPQGQRRHRQRRVRRGRGKAGPNLHHARPVPRHDGALCAHCAV